MKKFITISFILFIIVLSFGCSSKEQNKLTIDKVNELSKKGTELSWKDFEKYESKEIGSGIYILKYEIDDKYCLIIGGDTKEAPMYIRLVRNENEDDYIDIREENVEEFIKS